MTSAVIGIDPSQTAAGVAILAGSPTDTSRPVLLREVGDQGHRTDPWTKRARRIGAQKRRVIDLLDHFKLEHPDIHYQLAVVEGPAYANRLPSQFDRAGVFWGIIAALDARNILIAVINPVYRAMFATGRGNGDKKLVVSEIKALWSAHAVHITNDNRADSLALATMGAMQLGWQMPFTPRRRHVENIAKCDWPNLVTTCP